MAITWQSVPDYDVFDFGLFEDTSWNCDQWVEYHKALKSHFGAERAKFIWEKAFFQGAYDWNAKSGQLDCRTFNSAFRSYAKKEELDTYSSAGIFAPILNAVGATKDLASVLTNVVSGRSGKVILYSAIAVVGAVALFKAYKYATK